MGEKTPLSALLPVVTGEHFRRALDLVGWNAATLAQNAHVSAVEIERVLDDDGAILNAVINCLRALGAAGVQFELSGDRVTVELAR